MTKKEFLYDLKSQMEGYKDRDEVLDYYSEIIDDRILSGEKEADIIKSFGSVMSIAYKITGGNRVNDKIIYTERYDNVSSNDSNKQEEKKNGINSSKLIILLVLSPVILCFLCSLIGALIGLVCGFFGTSAGLMTSGVVGVISSCIKLTGETGFLITNIGMFIALFGIGLLVLFISIKLTFYIIVVLKKLINWIISLFSKGGWIYEK